MAGWAAVYLEAGAEWWVAAGKLSAGRLDGFRVSVGRLNGKERKERAVRAYKEILEYFRKLWIKERTDRS